MADGEGDQRDVIEYYFHLGYTNEIILKFLERFHDIKISLRTLKRRLRSFGLRRKGNIIDEARIQAVIRREIIQGRTHFFLHVGVLEMSPEKIQFASTVR